MLDIPDEDLWNVRLAMRDDLFRVHPGSRARALDHRDTVSGAQVVAVGTLLDPSALTIGFARRFTALQAART